MASNYPRPQGHLSLVRSGVQPAKSHDEMVKERIALLERQMASFESAIVEMKRQVVALQSQVTKE